MPSGTTFSSTRSPALIPMSPATAATPTSGNVSSSSFVPSGDAITAMHTAAAMPLSANADTISWRASWSSPIMSAADARRRSDCGSPSCAMSATVEKMLTASE